MDSRHSFERYLDRIYRQTCRQWACEAKDLGDFRRWQRRTRHGLKRLLTLHQREETPLQLRREVVSETRDYARERVSYDTQPGVRVPAWLFVPKRVDLPAPAVLCPPGHGGGMNQVVDESPGIYKRYPLGLVRRGFVVLVPEHLGFGERAGKPGDDRRANHPYLYHALNLLGESQQGIMVWDLMRALDVLQCLPEVTSKRIGCYGLSLGGETTLLLAAVDRRVRVACISGFLCSYKSSFLAESHCGCGYSFALGRYLEHVDLATLIAPRPLCIESATKDPIFPVDEAKKTFRQLRRLYRLCGAADRIVQDVFEGVHEISGVVAPEWLERWLRRQTVV
jgi:dienelactone hydrolase